jgi:multiple sugar transport system substrate-binding protein
MRKLFKRLLLVLIVVLLSISVFFNIAADNKKADSSTKKLVFLWWGSQTRHDMTLKVIDMFQKKHPNIKIEPLYTNWEIYYEKLNTMIAANETPDLQQQAIQTMQPYIAKSILTDLNKIKTFDGKDEAQTIRSMIVYNGKQYGACLGMIAPCLAYDPVMFKKAGVPVPGPKTTWTDMEGMIKKLNQSLKIYGSGYNGLENEFEVFIRERGESFITKDLKKAGFTEKTVVEFLKMVVRMQENGMEPVQVAIENRSNDENSTYAKNQAAMRFMWSNKIVSVSKTKKALSDITVHPGPNNENGTFIKPACHITIAESSKNKEEAGLFASFFVNDIEANYILNSERGIPSFSKVRKALTVKAQKDNDIQIMKLYQYFDFATKFNKRPMDTNFAVAEKEVRVKYRDHAELAFFKKATPEDAAKNMIAEINSILAK